MADKQPAKGDRNRLAVLLAVGVLVLGGGGAATAYLVGLFDGEGGAGSAKAQPAASGEEHAGGAVGDQGEAGDHGGGAGDLHGAASGENVTAEVPGGAVFVDLPDLLVNLQPDGKRMRFLRLKVAVEVGGEKAAGSVKALTPRVLDSFQMYLRALTVDEVQGSAGMQRLKEEMIARVNLAIEPSRIRDVLFKEILVQ